MNNPITLTLTPAQHQRLQCIIACWIEMLNQSTAVLLSPNLTGEAEKIIQEHGQRQGVSDDETIAFRP